MSFFKALLNIKDIKSPIFLKDFNDENKQLIELESLKIKVNDKNKVNLISKDILALKEGIIGEKNVYYELKNSYIPMLCLHNIRIESNGNFAQLDFVLITHYFIMILETKKLSGDIYINEIGEFTRSFKNNYGKTIRKEGIYSPISQNERHVRILKEFLIKNKLIRTFPVLSSVIIANPKSIINRYKAPHSIKNKIFKYDQLTEMLNKELSKYKKDENNLESKLYTIAKALITNNIEATYNNYKKYNILETDLIDCSINNPNFTKNNLSNDIYENSFTTCSKSGISKDVLLKEAIRKYRYQKSLEEKVKAYFIFNDKVLNEIVLKKPKSLKDLLNIHGLGEVKVSKYGIDILDIIKAII